ncbi:MAG: MFS transporter [Verrucomicrobia bacterium]|nr:MFS transporter [Verrucomicrobiota bacterium]
MFENPGSTASELSGLRLIVRAFRHRNFQLYFGGQCISLVGTWIQGVALGWTVYQMTHSAFLLGLVGFAGQFPLFLLTSLAGVFIDRSSRHRTLVITQTLSMLQALLLATLTYTHHLDIWVIIALNALAGTILAIDMPSRQAFLVDLVGHGPDLPNAIALNSFTVHSSRILGPAIAGLLLVTVSPALCFLLNGLSYIAVIAALLAMRLPPADRQPSGGRAHHELLEGVRYAWRFGPIRAILCLVALVSLTGASYAVLMPIFAVQIFHGGSHVLGYLMAVPGVGAMSAGLYLASRKSVLGAGIRIAIGAVVFGVSLLVFSQSRWMPLSLLALALAGLGIVTQMALSNTVLQTLVDQDKRGRVMSLFTMAFMGMAPFGSILAGALANRFGAPLAVALGGTACIAGGILFALQLPSLRQAALPIYRKKGILPEIASGLGAASDLSTPTQEP